MKLRLKELIAVIMIIVWQIYSYIQTPLYTYTHTHTHTLIFSHTCTQTYLHTNILTHIPTLAHTHTYTPTYLHTVTAIKLILNKV
jgi:hypothetical protein